MNKGEIYFNEFKDIFHNPDVHLKDDGLDLLHEFTSDLLQMSNEDIVNILQRIQTDIEVYRKNNSQCPKCGNEIIIIERKDTEKLEYFGTLCQQTIFIRKCPYCGWKEDD